MFLVDAAEQMGNLSYSNRGAVMTNLPIQLNQAIERANAPVDHIDENAPWKDDVFIHQRLGKCYEVVG